MTTTLYEDGGVTITQFAGGNARGVCVEVTLAQNPHDGQFDSVQLTRTQAETVVNVLAKWLGLAVSRG